MWGEIVKLAKEKGALSWVSAARARVRVHVTGSFHQKMLICFFLTGNVDAGTLQDMWDEYDTDRSGAVDADELTKLLTALVAKVGASADIPSLVDATIAIMDKDGDGECVYCVVCCLYALYNFARF
jgi:hypothetical protein